VRHRLICLSIYAAIVCGILYHLSDAIEAVCICMRVK
jgi:hypothetical protein